MEPGATFFVTRSVISAAEMPFQSRESTSHWMGSMPRSRMAVMTWSSYSPKGQRISVGRTPVRASILSLQAVTSAWISAVDMALK